MGRVLPPVLLALRVVIGGATTLCGVAASQRSLLAAGSGAVLGAWVLLGVWRKASSPATLAWHAVAGCLPAAGAVAVAAAFAALYAWRDEDVLCPLPVPAARRRPWP